MTALLEDARTLAVIIKNIGPEDILFSLRDTKVLSAKFEDTVGRPVSILLGRGPSPLSTEAAPYSGYIKEAIAVPLAALVLPASQLMHLHYGPWTMKVNFPKTAPAGHHDPLLVTGISGQGDFIYAFYPEPGMIAFGHDAWGVGGSASKSIRLDFEKSHELTIDIGGLYPPRSDPLWSGFTPDIIEQYKRRIRLTLDGAVIQDAPAFSHDAAPGTTTIGFNQIGGSSTAPNFLGTILSAERIKWDAAK